ncbi:MAG: hypothetical protein KDB27_01250 [Planctomycetales bacterium]|nr:hypothetical protein [Planctomycetales bacterium]
MRQTAIVVLSLLTCSTCLAALPVAPANANGVNVVYSPESGDLLIDSTAGPITTLELKSDSGYFTAGPHAALNGLFDVNTQTKIFKLDPAGFSTLSLEGALQTGLSFTELGADLSIDGSYESGGGLASDGRATVLVPEPASVGFSLAAISCLLFLRRK